MNATGLKTIIDIKAIQKIQDKIASATGMSLFVVEGDDMLTTISNPTMLVSDIIENSEYASDRIDEFVIDIKNKAERFNKYCTAMCSNGIVKIAVPITIDNSCVGVVLGGDVYTSEQNDTELSQAASDLKIDENSYKEAAKRVNIIPTSKIDEYCEMISVVFNSYVDSCSKSVKQASFSYDGNSNSEIASNIYKISEKMKKINSDSNEIFKIINNLLELTKTSEENIIKSKDIVKSIQNISLNTRILGFNASIEAARAKESGKGFSVIAQEVRSLADVSNSSAEDIERRIQKIADASNLISEQINKAVNAYKAVNESNVEVNNLFNQVIKLTSQNEEN